MEAEIIPKGAFLLARKLFESEIWLKKPATWLKIWVYILGNVNFEDKNEYKKGEGYFNFKKIDLGHDVTPDMIKKFCVFARKNEMISTRRSTRGTTIKVLNYNKYQTLNNYASTEQSTREAPEKHQRSTPIYKNIRIKELKNVSNISLAEGKTSAKSKNKQPVNKPVKEDSNTEKQIAEVINHFKSLNPCYKTLFSQPPQRKAAKRLIEISTFNGLIALIDKLPEIVKQPYCPKVTTPCQLERDLGKIKIFLDQQSKIISKSSIGIIN